MRLMVRLASPIRRSASADSLPGGKSGPWWRTGLGAACAASLLVASIALADQPAPQPAPDAVQVDPKLEALLESVEQQILAGHTIAPPNDNAMDTWVNVLEAVSPAPPDTLKLLTGFIAEMRRDADDEQAAGHALVAADLLIFVTFANDLLQREGAASAAGAADAAPESVAKAPPADASSVASDQTPPRDSTSASTRDLTPSATPAEPRQAEHGAKVAGSPAARSAADASSPATAGELAALREGAAIADVPPVVRPDAAADSLRPETMAALEQPGGIAHPATPPPAETPRPGVTEEIRQPQRATEADILSTAPPAAKPDTPASQQRDGARTADSPPAAAPRPGVTAETQPPQRATEADILSAAPPVAKPDTPASQQRDGAKTADSPPAAAPRPGVIAETQRPELPPRADNPPSAPPAAKPDTPVSQQRDSAKTADSPPAAAPRPGVTAETQRPELAPRADNPPSAPPAAKPDTPASQQLDGAKTADRPAARTVVADAAPPAAVAPPSAAAPPPAAAPPQAVAPPLAVAPPHRSEAAASDVSSAAPSAAEATRPQTATAPRHEGAPPPAAVPSPAGAEPPRALPAATARHDVDAIEANQPAQPVALAQAKPLGTPTSPPAAAALPSDSRSVGREAAPPPPASPQPAAPASAGPVAQSSMTEQPAAAMFANRGDALLKNKDVSGARKFYEFAAKAGSARAATALAQTYDPGFVDLLGTVGLKPDPAMAVTWYRKAAALGDRSAEARLRTLGAEASR